MRKFETTLITSGRDQKYTYGAINPIIQRTSSVVFNSIQQKQQAVNNHSTTDKLFYGRYGTITHFSLRQSMTELENGVGCVLYPCGTAAITHTILSFVQPGDHILMTGSAYEPTQKFCRYVLKRMNIDTTWFDPLIGNNISNLIRHNTRLVILESPGSITMEVQNVPSIVQAVRKKKSDIIILLDNTWSAGVFFKALDIGVDVSLQSGTKYIIGHSDGMIGTAVSNARCWDQLQEQSYLMGQMVDADTAYMASRGLRTLYVRLKQHEENGLHVAHWLAQHPAIERVNHPALSACKGHKYFIRDFSGSSGLFSFILKKRLNDLQLSNFINHFKYFKIAYSWGGFESLILVNQIEELRPIRPSGTLDFTGTLVRIHVGLEHPSDLIHDLSDALNRINV
ncbi:cystathionine beta-lyase [Candidatus Blochmanniella camponoti]|uniref:Cystathionine beta-lyase n=1 Tax=Candidatus Blochmanniella camponoti TaxID=108080 RepID=A0AAE9I6G5_9ENTR|nr:cystathionine beta-lyase [Candidatus Blochmannia herculeanus]URJ24509.1 cystathionine beta-lyase [Candidatus Blochmannia herculeanus]URJ26883.1 cystathionine beta-lyase [Candidatus Blochmannia herculeanus]URJ27313.1 cystathionine beta-lyase [Candidatus Blochmannia herculeanus]